MHYQCEWTQHPKDERLADDGMKMYEFSQKLNSKRFGFWV